MDARRLKAKRYLNELTKTEYDKAITEAFLTDRQEAIALLKRRDLPTWEIADRLHISCETVTRDIAKIYDKIAKVMTK